MDSDELGMVVLTVATAEWRAAIDNLEERSLRILRATLEHSTSLSWLQHGEVSLLLSEDDEIRDLNNRYRERNQPTNVLSFSNLDLKEGKILSPPPPGPVLLGDIAMSFQRLSTEADEQKKPLLDHFAHLLIHGTLHLLGYDHQNDKQALVMEGMEGTVLQSLGMAAPYEAGTSIDKLGALS